MTIEKILDDRGKRYGNYLKQTEISRSIRTVIDRGLPVQAILSPDQDDALTMIAVKISRIVNGDPDYSDNWRDIAGYATLVADRLDGKERT
jgi:hypothetical protein